MARHPRLDLPGIPQHVVQRGNDRQACFAAPIDYGQYLQELREAAAKHGCAIHAYVLMTNHVHLLATPAEAGAMSRMMQAVGRRYVGSFTRASGAPARYGKGDSKPRWSTPRPTPWLATATSSSTPCGHP